MSFRRQLARLAHAGPGSRPANTIVVEEAPPDATPLPAGDDAERRARIDTLRGLLESMKARRPVAEAAPPVADPALPGAVVDTAHGPVHLIEARYDPEHRHGHTPVAPAYTADAARVATLALDPELARVDWRRALFLDTETTGLGGAGAVPFLIGLAWFEDGALRLRQLLLRGPGEEAPMLRLLTEHLADRSAIVTYNGRSFDWPLLRGRFVLNRLKPPSPPPHLDLLHCARRTLKPRLGSARLVAVERGALGMHRVDDIDGSEIPEVYHAFVRTGRPGAMARVIEHNAHDLVAMAALLGHLVEALAGPRPKDAGDDLLAFANLAERAGDAEGATRFARAAAERPGPHAANAHLLLAEQARRAGVHASEEAALKAALTHATDAWALAHLHWRLAILYEHRLGRPDLALHHAHAAQIREPAADHQRRIERLRRRLDASC